MGKPNIRWVYTKDANKPFINPYSFVSQTEKVVRRPVVKGNLSGKISCRIKVKEQLVIPDSLPDEPQKYDFFHIDDRYMIPGSEIRGCIRSAYETITHSCFSVVNSEILSARESKPNSSRKPELSRKPGILMRRDGEWVIYEASYYNEKHYKKYRNKLGEPDVVRTWQKKGNKPELCKTYFYFDEDKEGYLIFAASCSDSDILKLQRAYEVYRSNLLNNDDLSVQGKEEVKVIEQYIQQLIEMSEVSDDDDLLLPIFYQCNKAGHISYISPAHTGVRVYENTVPKLLGEHDKCSGKDSNYCPACSLFGTLGENAPIASRVRFGDANLIKGSFSDYRILPELASPKISTVEFYSDKDGYTSDSLRWNYDDKGVALKGRKYYYHGLPQEADELGTRQVAVKSAEKGSEFQFELYFDDVKEEELKSLLWVLTLGDNSENSQYLHKLGMGKPVGYGSIKIIVDNIIERECDLLNSTYLLSKKSFADYELTGDEISRLFDKKALNDFRRITDYSLTVDETEKGSSERIRIAYPMGEKLTGKNNVNDRAGHQWFTSNRTADGKFRDVLPHIGSETADMRLYDVVGRQEVVQQGGQGKGKKAFSQSNFHSKNNVVSAASESGLVVGQKYQASIVKHYLNKNNVEMIVIEVSGIRSSLYASWFPDRIQRDLDAAVSSRATVRVEYKGVKNGYHQYWVDKKS